MVSVVCCIILYALMCWGRFKLIIHRAPINRALYYLLTSIWTRKRDIEEFFTTNADVNYDNGTPLLLAITLKAKKEILKMLIELGADVNYVYTNGSVPLFHAVIAGNIPAFKILVEYGADVNYKIKDGSNLLMCAKASEQKKMVKFLTDNYNF